MLSEERERIGDERPPDLSRRAEDRRVHPDPGDGQFCRRRRQGADDDALDGPAERDERDDDHEPADPPDRGQHGARVIGARADQQRPVRHRRREERDVPAQQAQRASQRRLARQRRQQGSGRPEHRCGDHADEHVELNRGRAEMRVVRARARLSNDGTREHRR
jgi:hypothetical protein